MIILVTGGAGFVGSNLCSLLVQNKDNHIICLDNMLTGSLKNIEHLRNYSNFEFMRHDIITPIYLEVDQIYHLACPASPDNYQKNGIKTIKTNILGTLNMLGLAKRTKARILLTSTSEVYGDPEVSPQTEEYWGNVNPVGIRSCYDEGKRLAESLMVEYHRNCDVDIRIARLFNTYGPGLQKDDGRVISNFIYQALEGKDITIYGRGYQTRSFCYIDDMINGLVKLMTQEKYKLPVNLGNPQEFTVKELAEIVKEKTKSQSKIVHLDLPEDDPQNRKPCIDKAKYYLDWTPKIDLEEGLDKTIAFFTPLNN